jgi:hypothetical protein
MRRHIYALFHALQRYEQQPLYYCVSCGGYYPIGHFCQ